MAANIFKGAANYRAVLDTEIDADSPDSALYRSGVVQAIETLLIHAFGTGIRSTFTADPSNDANGYAYDTAEIDTDDEFNGMTLVILSGAAVGNFYIIDNVTAGSNRLECTGDNLYSDGVRSGDDYTILHDIKRTTDLGHNHDGVNSRGAPAIGSALCSGVETMVATGSTAYVTLMTYRVSIPSWVSTIRFQGYFYTANATYGAYVKGTWDSDGAAAVDTSEQSTTALTAQAFDQTLDVTGNTGSGALSIQLKIQSTTSAHAYGFTISISA